MGISKFYETLKEDFFLYGQLGDDFPQFEDGVDYDAFLAQRKFD